MSAAIPTAPRIPPLPQEQWTDVSREVFSIVEGEEARRNGSQYNTILVVANHPDLALKYLPFSDKLLRSSDLPHRWREIVVLRCGFLYNCNYIVFQHRIIAAQAGLSPDEIEATQGSPDSVEWTPFERTIIRAIDELRQQTTISDATWAALAEKFDHKQLLEFVFTVGNYGMYAMYLNSCGVQLEGR